MKRFRMDEWAVAALVLVALIALIAPQQLGVTAYKLSLLSLSAVAGYLLDTRLFPGARMDAEAITRVPALYAAAMLRRALIVGACILGVSLGA